MRIGKEKSSFEREDAFRALKNMKIKQDFDYEDSGDELVTDLTRRLKQNKDTYKCKLPFKCFNCGKLGHFTSKCPDNAKHDDEDEDTQENRKGKKRKKFISRIGRSNEKTDF